METKEILQDIINNFSPDKFVRFFRGKSNKFAPRQESFTQYNDVNFQDGKKLGEITFDGTEQLAVFAFRASQSLSERSGKKAQYEKGKKILKDRQYDAGIFIFYDQDGNFRFSLIYANYLGKKRDWSAFRRFTYFVSREFTNKTFCQRIGDGDFSSLEKIKDAFSVEKVTKEFYEDIANWYFWAVQNVKFPKDAEEEENGRNIAVIRLITRMIFIWFMREQGLVPKNLFAEKSISAMLEDISPKSPTYYQAILQNLFFAVLSTKKDERKFRSEIRGHKGYNPDFGNQNVFRFQELFQSPDKLKDYFGEIPFLNGGLFECLDDKSNGIYIDGFTSVKKNQPNIPNILFFSGERKEDLNAAYGTKNKTYKVRGLLNILSSFNFTIDENSPDDQDIALDPELLGRVFENLLASFNPETSTTARKATGSYYTPREIVDYMVGESLKAYFKTHLSALEDSDKKIDLLFSTASEENPFNKSESKKLVELIESVRIVDPAVGSGAFPMGALNKLVFILNKVDPGNELWKQAQLSAVEAITDPLIKQDTKNRIEEFFQGKNADYGRKLYLIQKCIYGVDIQQIAVEIAKLRFFISLLVDEKIDKHKDNWGIEPLPNLDFKIMQGNSLISEFLGIDFDNGQEKKDTPGQIELCFENEDDSLIKEFERKKIDYQNASDKDKKATLKNEVEDLMIKIFEAKLQKKHSELKSIETRAQSIPNLKMREEYIKAEKEKFSKKHGFDLGNIEKQLREFTSKKKTRPFFPWKLYFAEVFEKGGFDIVIGNPPYIFSRENLTVRDKAIYKENYTLTQFKINLYILFIEKAFDILNDSGTLAFIIPNNWLTLATNSDLRYFLLTKCFGMKIVLNYDKVFENASVDTCILIFEKKGLPRINSYQWNADGIKLIKNQISNFYLSKNNYILGDLALQGDGSFEICEKINAMSKVLSDFAEVKNGVQAYTVGEGEPKQTEEMKEGRVYHSRTQRDKTWIKYLDGIDVMRYRIGWCGEFIKYGKNLSRRREPFLFQGERLLVRQIPCQPPYCIHCCYTNEHTINDNNSMIIKITNPKISLKYLLGLLNSKLISFWFMQAFGKLQRKIFPQFKVKELRTFPVKEIAYEKQEPIINLVDKIVSLASTSDYLTNHTKQSKTKEYERQIDQIVYNLYGLTYNEIKIVEDN